MIIIRRILCIALALCLIGNSVYGFTNKTLNEDATKTNLEETYGINIVIPDGEEYKDYGDCMMVLECGLRRFPNGVIKEITNYYLDNKITTNIILSKTEKVGDLFYEYKLNTGSADIHLNVLKNSLYHDTCAASEESLVREMSHFAGDYIFRIYGHEKIKKEFDKFNEGYPYGTWGEGYDKVYANKHSAMSLRDEVADLIWLAVTRPDVLRNASNGDYSVIHKKIEYLASVADQCFVSVTPESRLWLEAIPQKPDEWALEVIKTMKEASLIPEEFDGVYNSYITKEDFYTLALNITESKLGEEEFVQSFEIINQENNVAIDPVKGEAFVNKSEKTHGEKRLQEAYQMGLIDESWRSVSKEYMTRLEAAKLFSYIGNELGMDISDYKVIDYNDISDVKETEKPLIYFAANLGLFDSDEADFRPSDFCTYQEAYMMLMKFYDILQPYKH
ncbi:MAG TPA: hypothetical protein DEF04_08730 [Clostridiales bacterium]|nr:hypothetical protein [Clostridiales bacterium]